MTSGVAVLVLGPVQARGPSGPVRVPGLKLQALLALLALSAPDAVSDGRLIEELWGGERLSNPSNSLHSQIAILRRAIGRDVVVRRGLGYALAVEPDDVDAQRFERLVDRSRRVARDDDPRSAAQGFQTAISMITGPPLGDLIDYPFAQEAAARLTELQLAAHEGLADAELASGRHAELIAPLTELVRAHPLRERFHAQLIRALYRSGRQADALRAFGAARTTLREELGVEPGPELRDLELSVLSHAPALVAPLGREVTRLPRTTPEGPQVGPPFVGRVLELDLLRSDLDDAFTGRGRVALLSGEPGIGKSRLAEELAAEAEARGCTVAWGRCHAGRGAPAFWPWTQAIQSLVERVPAEVFIPALGRGAAEIGRLAPDVRDLLREPARPPLSDPEFERFRWCDSVTRFLCRLAAATPLMIVLEDLHWADAPSLELLSFLAGAVVEAPLLIVGTSRSVGAPVRGPLRETLADLARQPVVRRLDIAGLDRDAVHALVAATGHAATDELVGAVFRRTQGNPFFLVETLRLRSSRGDVEHIDSVPSGVREVIRQRFALLAESAVDAMASASVLGTEFDLSTLAASVDVDNAGTLEALEPAFDAGLVVSIPEHPGRYRFSHVLVRDTLYEDLGVATRARLHQRAAEALEHAHGATDGPHLIALAGHWFNAVPAAEPDRGVGSALRAARWAKQHVAYEQAEDQLRSALVLLAGIPEGRHRAELELGVQFERSMLAVARAGYASPGVEAACARMRELCADIDDPSLLMPALWRLSIFYLFNNHLDDAVNVADQLIGLAGPGSDPGPQLAGAMMQGLLHTHRGELTVARHHLDVADELCRAGHAHHVAGFVAETPAVWIAMFSAWNWSLLGRDDRAERDAQIAIDLAGAVAKDTNCYALVFAIWIGALVATLRRDVEATRRRCEQGIALATSGGYGMEFVPFMAAHAGWAEGVVGDVDAGHAEIVAAAADASGARMWGHVFSALLADVQLAHGHFGEALAHADAGLSQLAPGGARSFEAELHRLRGAALAGLDASDPTATEEMRRAIAIADRQGAVAMRRLAAAGLADLTRDSRAY